MKNNKKNSAIFLPEKNKYISEDKTNTANSPNTESSQKTKLYENNSYKNLTGIKLRTASSDLMLKDKEQRDPKKDGESSGESGITNGKVSTSKFKKYIIKRIIQPTYINDIHDVLAGRAKYRKVSKVLLITSFIFESISTILIFIIAALYSNKLAIIAGCIGVLSGISLHGSLMAKGESKTLTQQANNILKELGIDGIADIELSKGQQEMEKFEENNLAIVENINKELCAVLGKSSNDAIINVE